MKEFFKGHRDARKINEFLNAHSEDSRDFQIVYRLRKMGERFVDGSLTLQEVEDNRDLLLHSTGQALGISKSDAFKAIAEKEPCAQAEAMAFIQEMGGWPFSRCGAL